jgi:hypothetical protein
MSLGMGRRWFCSKDEAEAAGWRPRQAQRQQDNVAARP